MKKPYKIEKGFAEKWLKALRSGDYEQQREGYLMLNRAEEDRVDTKPVCRFCCLGVAAKIVGVPEERLGTEYIYPSVLENLNEGIKFPEIIKDQSELAIILSSLNDGLSKAYFKEYMEDNESSFRDCNFRFDIKQHYEVESEVKFDFNQIADFIEDNCEFYEEPLKEKL